MALVRGGAQGWREIKAGMVIFSVAKGWGHAMLVEPSGDGLQAEVQGNPPRIKVLHMAPPLQSDTVPNDFESYLGFCELAPEKQDALLRDVCAAIASIKALASDSPLSGLVEKPYCYSIAPSGILTSLLPSGRKTTSCTGLVEDCYNDSDFPIVDIESLPIMSFRAIREYIERFDSRIVGRSERFVREFFGLPQNGDEFCPLFTSYQMIAFEKNIFPYQVLDSDPQDVVRWQ